MLPARLLGAGRGLGLLLFGRGRVFGGGFFGRRWRGRWGRCRGDGVASARALGCGVGRRWAGSRGRRGRGGRCLGDRCGRRRAREQAILEVELDRCAGRGRQDHHRDDDVGEAPPPPVQRGIGARGGSEPLARIGRHRRLDDGLLLGNRRLHVDVRDLDGRVERHRHRSGDFGICRPCRRLRSSRPRTPGHRRRGRVSAARDGVARARAAADQLVDHVRHAGRFVGGVVGDVARNGGRWPRGGRRPGASCSASSALSMSAAVGGSNRADGTGTGRVVVLRARVNGPEGAVAGAVGRPRTRAEEAASSGSRRASAAPAARPSAFDPAPSLPAGPDWPPSRAPHSRRRRGWRTPDDGARPCHRPWPVRYATTPACSAGSSGEISFSSVGWLSGASL